MTAKKILVVDDEAHFADMLKTVLEQNFYLVDRALHPNEALSMIEANGYGLVLTDFKMPGMDGAQFMTEARKRDPELPVMIVSGLMTTPDLLRVANLGVTRVFEKPVVVDNLIESISQFVQPLTGEMFTQLKSSEADSGASPVALRQYNRPLKHFSDDSLSVLGFLNQLALGLKDQFHVFLCLPAGSEVELILREMGQWHHRAEAKQRELFVIQAQQFDPQTLLDRLVDLESRSDLSHVIGIVNYEHATMQQQQALVHVLMDAPEALIFVHCVTETFVSQSPERFHPELLSLYEQSHYTLPPLQQRRADLVKYSLRYLSIIARSLGKHSCATLHPSALPALLDFQWPGNFAQLLDALHRTVNLMTEAQPVTGKDLARALEVYGYQPPAEMAEPGLEERLVALQKKILLKQLPQFGNQLGELLEAAQVPPELAAAVDRLEDLPLLYPDLMESTS
jgi:DNA-binding NtrC family response regulator